MKILKRTPICIIVLLIGAFFFASCNKKTEREEYDSLCKSMKHKAYKTLSMATVPPLIKIYNTSRDTLPVVQEESIRLLLGYLWAVTQKPSFAIAEGNIVLDKSDIGVYKSLAHMLIGIAMYESGWKTIAHEETQMGVDILQKEPGGKYTEIEIISLHLLLGTSSIYDKNFEAAKFHFAGFATMTGINWPFQIADAMADIYGGKLQQGLQKVKAISEDPTVPVAIQEIMKTGITEVEKKTGDVDSTWFWPRTVSVIIFDELKKVSGPGVKKVLSLLDDVKSKLGMD